MIIPFFIRSQKIYNWDIDEFQERANELDLRIDKIIFKDLNSFAVLGSTSGNTIELNSRIFLNKNGKIIGPVARTMFHELAHITDKNQREGTETRERLQKPLLGQFYEWSNTIFDRLASGKNFYKKKDAMQLSNAGYQALAPLGSILSCALGIPEIEFAKIKDNGKEYEAELLKKMFPEEGETILTKVKEIFNNYSLDPNSLSEKKGNQSLLNQLYIECLEIMKKRISNELQSDNIVDIEKYKKYQMFYLKKINFNFKSASKSDGFRMLRTSIIHDIGFCTDQISKNNLLEIAKEHIRATEFGFDNSTLEKYSAAMIPVKDKKAFLKRLRSFSIVDTESKEVKACERRVQNNKER